MSSSFPWHEAQDITPQSTVDPRQHPEVVEQPWDCVRPPPAHHTFAGHDGEVAQFTCPQTGGEGSRPVPSHISLALIDQNSGSQPLAAWPQASTQGNILPCASAASGLSSPLLCSLQKATEAPWLEAEGTHSQWPPAPCTPAATAPIHAHMQQSRSGSPGDDVQRPHTASSAADHGAAPFANDFSLQVPLHAV